MIRGPSLLLTQAQFEWEIIDGKRRPKPGPAKLVILTPGPSGWSDHVLNDPDSRVFHKAVCRSESEAATEKQIWTIGATDAHLKRWQLREGQWKDHSLWKPKFGGKWDRLRDFEVGDVDGDGTEEWVIATHDQGVVAALEIANGAVTANELTRTPDTFIHEIEIGAVGGGPLAIYATPSAPNKADRTQGGSVVRFVHTGTGFNQETVATFRQRHAKEILVTDLNDDGRDELLVSLEARTVKQGGTLKILEPLEIRGYRPGKKGWKHRTLAKLEQGVQARVMLAGDLFQTGHKELIVTTWKDGIWRLIPTARGLWKKEQIDADSSGFEHAATLADIDGDGTHELYVAADDQDEVRQYRWVDGALKRDAVFRMEKSDITWSIEACGAP